MPLNAPKESGKLPLIGMLLFFLFSAAAPLVAQDPPVKVTLGKKELTAPQLKAAIDALIKNKERVDLTKKENKTDDEKKRIAAWDRQQGEMERLHALMIQIESGNKKKLAALKKEKADFDKRANTARDAAKDIQLEGEVDQARVDKLNADRKAKESESAKAKQSVQQAQKTEADRKKDFDNAEKKIGALEGELKKLNEDLAKEGLGASEKSIIETEIFIKESEIQAANLERAFNASFAELDKASLEQARAWDAAAQAELNLARDTYDIANVKLGEALKKKAEDEKKKAAELKRKALEEQSKTRKAVLQLQALLSTLEAAATSEEEVKTGVINRGNRLDAEIKDIQQIKGEIADLLPEDVELDDFKEDYLKRQLKRVEFSLLRHRKTREEYQQYLQRLRRDISSTRFKVQALEKALNAENANGFGSNLSLAGDNKDLEDFLSIRNEWERHSKDVEAFDLAIAKDIGKREEMRYEKSQLESLKTTWDETIQKIKTTVQNRLGVLNETFAASKECLQKVDIPVQGLEAVQQDLTNKAFWLKEDPPFGEIRRTKMEDELSDLKSNWRGVLSDAWDDFYTRIKDVEGISGTLLLAAAFLLMGYRRAKQQAIEGARAAYARTDDPLYRLLSMSAWLFLEIAHHILAIAGIMLVFVSFQPTNPLAATAESLFALAAFRLALLRVLLYAEVADQETSKLLFIDARQLIKITMIGLFIVVPPIAFFENAGFVGLGQATRLVGTCWIFIIAVRLAFRRDIILLLLPSKDIGALSRGIKLLVHYFWPLLTAFIALIGYFKLVGYRTASEELASRSFLAGGVLLAAMVLYQFVQAYIDSKTTAITQKDSNEKGHSETKEEKRYRATVRRVFSLPLLFVTSVATIVAMSWAVGVTESQWESWGDTIVIEAVTKPSEKKDTPKDAKSETSPAKSDSEKGADAKSGEDIVVPAFKLRSIGWAFFILALGYVLGSTIRDVIVIGGTAKMSEDRRGTRYALGTLIFYILMSITIIFSLRTMNVNLADYGWLLGTAGVALGFGMTEILSNFVCGIILFIERPVQVGDIITVGDVEGDVRKISIRSTIVQTRDGVSIILPNRRLIEADVVNWSHSDPLTRLRIDVGAAYGSDVALVKKAMMEVAVREGRVLKRPHPEVTFKQFGESELSFQLLCWLPTPDITVHRRVRSDLNSAIDAAFRRYDIEIPFPQRDLHLRSTPETIAEAKLAAEEEKRIAEEQKSKEGAEAAAKDKEGPKKK